MSRSRQAQFDELLDRALDIPRTEQELFLRSTCEDPGLRLEILNLLQKEENLGSFLEQPAADAFDPDINLLTWSLITNASWLSGAIDTSTGEVNATPVAGDVGWYWVNVSVNDGVGGMDHSNFTLYVVDPIAPIADITAPSNVVEDASVSFDASGSSDNSGTITSYHWSFGDGSEAMTALVSHSYEQSGTYTVILTVMDPSGNIDVLITNKPIPTAKYRRRTIAWSPSEQ